MLNIFVSEQWDLNKCGIIMDEDDKYSEQSEAESDKEEKKERVQ